MSPEEILTEHVVDIHRIEAASATGTLGPDVEKKMLSNSKLRESGISLPCRKHLSMWNTIFFVNGFT